MAVALRLSSAGGGTSSTGDRTSTIAALIGDLLVVIVKWSGNSNTSPTCTDNGTGTHTYTRILTAGNNASADIMAVFVRDVLVAANATLTIAPVVGGGNNTAGEIVTLAFTGMTKLGAAAIRGSGKQENQTSGVPAPVLSAAALTENMTVQIAGSSAASGTITAVPNASWAETQDAQQSTPSTALEVATRASGFTGTSALYVSIVSVLWSSAILELDGTAPVGTSLASTWNIRAAVGTSKASTWNIRAAVGASKAST